MIFYGLSELVGRTVYIEYVGDYGMYSCARLGDGTELVIDQVQARADIATLSLPGMVSVTRNIVGRQVTYRLEQLP